MAKLKNATAAAWLEARADKPHIHTEALIELPTDKLEFRVLSDEQVVLNNHKAAAYIELPVFPGEREVSDPHVQHLYDEMTRGSFNPLLVILSSCEFQGVIYKINGQHTCWAKFYAEGYEPKVREIKYKVQTAEQLRQLYATYDRGKARSDAHLTKIELSNNVQLHGVPDRVLGLISSAMRFWTFNETGDRSRSRPQDIAALIGDKHLNLCLAVGNFIAANVGNKPETSWIRRRCVVAAMMETFSKSVPKSLEFWQPVCDGIGLESKTDPRWQLRSFLQSVVINSASRRGTRSVSEEDIYNHCIPAYNKWRKGEEVRQLRPVEGRIKAI